MIARRVGDDAASALFRRQLRRHVEGAADLERAARLEALALEAERLAANR